jgi:hypothetical protein
MGLRQLPKNGGECMDRAGSKGNDRKELHPGFLYVDDRKVLPPDEQFLFTTADQNKKSIKTIGDKYATLRLRISVMCHNHCMS